MISLYQTWLSNLIVFTSEKWISALHASLVLLSWLAAWVGRRAIWSCESANRWHGAAVGIIRVLHHWCMIQGGLLPIEWCLQVIWWLIQSWASTWWVLRSLSITRLVSALLRTTIVELWCCLSITFFRIDRTLSMVEGSLTKLALFDISASWVWLNATVGGSLRGLPLSTAHPDRVLCPSVKSLRQWTSSNIATCFIRNKDRSLLFEFLSRCCWRRLLTTERHA